MSSWDCSLHNHCTLCDGKSSAQEMARAAFSLGLGHFGLSCHSHTPIPHDAGQVLPQDLGEYRRSLEGLREAYAGRMEVLFGIEQDSETVEPVPDFVDYWIGSVHNLHDRETGRYHALDWDREKLLRCRDEMFGGDPYALAEGYFQAVGEMAERCPSILGHIDLLCKLNGDGSLFDEEAPRYKAAALEALHRCQPQKTLLEINTGALSRGYRKRPYPALFLLREWRAMGGQVIFSADAHHQEHIVYGFSLAEDWAKAAGFRERAILTGAGMELRPLSISKS